MFGTFYDRPERPNKSPTVFNLGYAEEVAKLYPHVAELSGGVATGHPRERIKADGGLLKHVLSEAEGSPTVFNLGYTEGVAEKYPRVAKLPGGVATGHPRKRVREKAGA